MTALVPISVQLDGLTFRKLEAIAGKRGITVRQLIVDHLLASLSPEPHRRVVTRTGKPVRHHDIDAWIEAASMGVTNRVIAQRWGVSESLVSRYLRERGVFRQASQRESDERNE